MMRAIIRGTCAACLALALPAGAATGLAASAAVDAEDRIERVRFAAGETGITIRDEITGDAIADYLVGASAGQTMAVTMQPAGTAYFNVITPSGDTIFVGRSATERAFEGVLEESGDHTIRLYLLGADADEGRTVDYRLDIAVVAEAVPRAAGAVGPVDALVAETQFHATGEIDCVAGGAPARCQFGVVRHGDGTADVVITRPDGLERTIFFEKGEAIGADTSEADRGAFAASRSGDTTIVTVGEERYEIFDAVIFGG